MIKKKILIVEDEPEMRTMLALELETSGYDVFQAGDGDAGFRLAAEVRPDLIISDMMMPAMDGNQLLKKLRASDFGKDIPFVVLTARGKMRDYFEAVKVDEFIEKPFNADDFLSKVESVLARSKAKEPLPRQISSADTAGLNQASPPVKKPKISNEKRKVLLVENDLAVYVELQNTFRDYGYEVKVVNLPSKCLEEMAQFIPDVIVAKYSLDQITGDKLAELIRGMPHYHDIPIIIYTRTLLGEEKENAMRAGASYFVADVNAVKLLKRINELFG